MQPGPQTTQLKSGNKLPVPTFGIDKNSILVPEDIWLLNNNNDAIINVRIPAYEDDSNSFKEQILPLKTI